jgi:uridine kinase
VVTADPGSRGPADPPAGRAPAAVEAAATRLAALVATAPALVGTTRLVCVDGPAGSGKTTLADSLVRRLRAAATTVELLHMDDVYEGWAGLDVGMATVATSVVLPLQAGRAGRYRRFDWHREEFAEEHRVRPVGVLVVEGVGSGGAAYADVTSLLVWVTAPSAVRLERGVARDGEHLRERWLAWRAAEDAMFERERTRERADVVVDGLTGEVREQGSSRR